MMEICSRILLSIARDPGELDGLPSYLDVSVIVAFSTSGGWPSNVRGTPVIPIFDLIDPGSCTDRALTGVVEWMSAAAASVGDDGRKLGELRTASGFPLWWCADHSVSTLAWLRIRSIEALKDLLERFDPDFVAVWGNDPEHFWLRSTLISVLEEWSRQATGRSVESLDLSLAALSGARARWASRPDVFITDIWLPSRDMATLDGSVEGAGELGLGGTVLATAGARARYIVPQSASFLEMRMRWRRGERYCLRAVVENGRRQAMLEIADGSVRLCAEAVHPMDTSIFHKYRIEIDLNSVSLFVDDTFVAEARAKSSITPIIEWGHCDADETTRAEWSWLVWGTHESASATEPAGSVSSRQGLEIPKLLKAQPESNLALPRSMQSSPRPGDVCVMGWGAHLSYFLDNGTARIVEPYAEGILDELEAAGIRTSCLWYGNPTHSILTRFPDAGRLPTIAGWRPAKPTYEDALSELRCTWRDWLGSGSDRRLPAYSGVDQDELILPHIERLLADLAVWIQDSAALDKYVAENLPSAVIFSNFASSHRHFVEIVNGAGVKTIATSIGLDIHPWLFYGLRGTEPCCPQASVYPVWGEWQAEILATECPLIDVVATGRTRHDTIVSVQPERGWLQRIGLPSNADHIVIFGDVLLGTLQESILTPESWRSTVAVLLESVVDHPEIHVVIKPWAGDFLPAILDEVRKIDSMQLHVVDPTASGYHNAQLLKNALTVVSSPTSFLAEFAATGGAPIALSLPETRYYHGDRLHELYGGFCAMAHNLDELRKLLRTAIECPEAIEPSRLAREVALSQYFGPSDGKSATRYAEVVAAAIGRPKIDCNA